METRLRDRWLVSILLICAVSGCRRAPVTSFQPSVSQGGRAVAIAVHPFDPNHILVASEMVGAVRGVDPETGHYYDDTKRYIDASSLSAADKQKIFEGNIRRVFPRMGAAPIS